MDDALGLTLIVGNGVWDQGPNLGYLTPTVLTGELPSNKRTLYGAVRDELGQAVIRRVEVTNKLETSFQQQICFDRRSSGDFDTHGTILGHVSIIGNIVRLYYVGFRRSERVKFEAYSGFADSYDNGKTFEFKQAILNKQNFTFLNGSVPDIVACHWNNLNVDGNGQALVALGNGWIESNAKTYPKYSSFFIDVENFQFKNLISRVPQKDDIYRLGRPRFLESQEMKLAVLTGGKITGDYRSYFFDFRRNQFFEKENLKFPIRPTADGLFKKQVSYPELINFLEPTDSIFVFNGDDMGADGCYSVNANGWWI